MLEKSHYYPGQTSQEEIVLFVRKSKIAYLNHQIIIFFLAIIPWVVPWVIDILSRGAFDMFAFYTGDSKGIAIPFLSAWYLFIMGYFLTTWTDVYLDVLIITKENLVHVRQEGLFNRSVSEQNLLKVQDVQARIVGLLGNFFKVGSIAVETAGELPNFKMTNIENPLAVANTIMRLSNELLDNSKTKDGINFIKDNSSTTQKDELPLIKISKQDKNNNCQSEIITVKKSKPLSQNSDKSQLSKKVNIISSSSKPEELKIESSWIDNNTQTANTKESVSKQKSDYLDGELKEGEDLEL